MNGKLWTYFTGAVGVFGALIMSLPHPVQILLVLMGIDVALGAIAAVTHRSVSSDALWKGLAKKAAILLLIAALATAEPVLQFDAADYAAVFFVVAELVSIVELAALLGVPIPERVTRVLAVMRGKANEPNRDQVQSITENQG
jgi:toxin secretion/phage lysis holin